MPWSMTCVDRQRSNSMCVSRIWLYMLHVDVCAISYFKSQMRKEAEDMPSDYYTLKTVSPSLGMLENMRLNLHFDAQERGI